MVKLHLTINKLTINIVELPEFSWNLNPEHRRDRERNARTKWQTWNYKGGEPAGLS